MNLIQFSIRSIDLSIYISIFKYLSELFKYLSEYYRINVRSVEGNKFIYLFIFRIFLFYTKGMYDNLLFSFLCLLFLYSNLIKKEFVTHYRKIR